MGTINKPFYRIVVADSRFATTGRFLEILGWYDPKQKGANFSVNVERVKHWMGIGAQISNTAASLLKKAEAGLGAPISTIPVDVSVEASAKAEKAPEQLEA